MEKLERQLQENDAEIKELYFENLDLKQKVWNERWHGKSEQMTTDTVDNTVLNISAET